ncbi:MAG: SCO family protein [Acidimicrobiia bacterium]|nr:SCO family protein [Acidimicrobiia bacterium]
MTTTIERDENPVRPPKRRMGRAEWRMIAAVAVIGVGLGVFLFQPHTYAGTVLQSPRPAPSLEGLTFSNGEPADLAVFEGDVVLMYFGYTNCPDICPTSMATIARAKEVLGDDADRIHALLVTVDPERDTAEALNRYLGNVDRGFLGVYGPEETLMTTAMLYGIHSEVHDEAEELGYTVDHTGTIIAIGPDGHVRVLYSHTVTADDLSADLAELLG